MQHTKRSNTIAVLLNGLDVCTPTNKKYRECTQTKEWRRGGWRRRGWAYLDGGGPTNVGTVW